MVHDGIVFEIILNERSIIDSQLSTLWFLYQPLYPPLLKIFISKIKFNTNDDQLLKLSRIYRVKFSYSFFIWNLFFRQLLKLLKNVKLIYLR